MPGRSFVDDGGPVVPIIHHGRKMLSADTAKGPGKPHKVHADISAAISRAVSKGSMMGKKLTLPKSVAERMSVVGVRKVSSY